MYYVSDNYTHHVDSICISLKLIFVYFSGLSKKLTNNLLNRVLFFSGLTRKQVLTEVSHFNKELKKSTNKLLNCVLIFSGLTRKPVPTEVSHFNKEFKKKKEEKV